MNILFYIILFSMGAMFGSFLTLATYRIPKNKDITHEHSFCPSCNHKLEFIDLIPILSYIFLRGRCRYCGKKIGVRYILFEILTGCTFLLLAFMLDFNAYTCYYFPNKIVEYILGVLYVVFIFLVAGIDLENHKVDSRVLIYGTVVTALISIYRYFAGLDTNTIRLIIYLSIIVILLMVNIMNTKKNKKLDYEYNSVIYLIMLSICTYEITTILIVVFALFIVSFRLILSQMKNKSAKATFEDKRLPIVFYMSVAHMLILCGINYFEQIGF